jgi:hypothetical protein
MILLELFDPGVQGYQDIEADNSKPVWRTSRKTKLTLKQVRKLRRMLDVRNYERRTYLKKIQGQYGPQAGAEGAAPTL